MCTDMYTYIYIYICMGRHSLCAQLRMTSTAQVYWREYVLFSAYRRENTFCVKKSEVELCDRARTEGHRFGRYTRTYICTCINTCVHTYMHTYKYIPTYMHTYMQTYMHKCIHTYTQVCVHAYIQCILQVHVHNSCSAQRDRN